MLLAIIGVFGFLVCRIADGNFKNIIIKNPKKYYEKIYKALLLNPVMWFFPTKKEIKKAFDKIKADINSLNFGYHTNAEKIEELKGEVVSKKEIDLIIREAILQIQTGQDSAPSSAPKSEPNKVKHFEQVMVRNAVKHRPEVIRTAIRGLIERDMRTTDIFNVVVSEKKLCGKTQFYHYLSLVRNELRTELRPKVRTG